MNTRLLGRGFLLFILWASLAVFAGCSGDSPSPAPGTKGPESKTPPAATTPLFEKKEIADWCPEHGVPESICTRCNESLIEGFKKKGDWCTKHGLPDSQCFTCHPELKAKFEAKAPKK